MKTSVSRHHLVTAAATLVVVTAAHAVGTTQTYDDTSALNVWNTTDSNWDASAAPWTNDNDAIFAGTGEAVAVAAVSAHGLAINSSGYSFTGGTLTLTGTTPTITANADTSIASSIAGTAGLTKGGSGVLTLSGATPYTGDTTVSTGTLRFNFGGNSLGSATVANNTNVEFYRGGNGGTMVTSKLSGAGTWTVDGPGGGPDQWSNRVILTGTGSDNTGTINVINGGKLWSQLTATNNPIGDTADVNLATGTIFTFYGPAGLKETIGGLNGSGTVDFSDGGGGKALTLEVGGGDKNGSFSGVIQNVGTSGGPTVLSISKTGSGTQILTGTHTYTGTTTVNAGTLQMDGALASGAVTVAGGTLSGTGTIGGGVTVHSGGTFTSTGIVNGTLAVQAGGTLSPAGAATIGTLTVDGATELAGSSVFQINKAGAALTKDMLSCGGNITYGGNLTVTATGDALAVGDSFQLFELTGGGTFSGGFSSFSLPNLPAGRSWDTSTLNTTGTITVVNYVGTPTFNPPAGGYIGAQSVTITSDSGSTIHYTVDGSDPTTSGTKVSTASPASGITIPLGQTITIKAYASKSGQAPSPVAQATYTAASSAAWNVDNNGNWSDPANWLNGVIPNAINAPANFQFAQSASTTVTLDSSRTVGSMTFGNANAVDWTVSSSGSTLTLAGTSPTISVLDNAATIAAPVLGNQGLIKTGAGVLALSGSNSLTGTIQVTDGVLASGSFAANGSNTGLGAGTDVTLNGGTLRYTGGNNGSDAGAKFNRNISVGANGGTIDIGGSGFLFCAATLSGSGTLKVVDGNGDASNRQLLVTSNSPGFTGNIEIGNGNANSGWVQYRSNAASPFGTGTITIKTGGILSSDNGSTVPATLANNILLNGGTLGAQSAGTNFTGDVTATTATTSVLTTNLSGGANLVIGGKLLGNGTLQKTGGGNSVELRGDNSGFAGTYNHTADGATIFYTANSASAATSWNIPTGSNAAARFMAAAANATYKMGSLSGVTGRLENLNAASGNSVFEIGALNTDTTFGGVIRNGGGGTVAIKKVGSGKLTLTGADIHTGGTIVNAGTLELVSPGSLTFAPGANGVVNGVTGTGAANLDGVFNITLTGANTTDGNSWTLVDNATLTETYGANFSVAGFTEATPGVWTKNDGTRVWTFTEATGKLTLPGGGYSAWETANGIAGAGSAADSDGDGIANGIEFVIGGDPSGPGSDSSALLPTVSTDATYLKFVFRRTDASAPNNPSVEYTTTLAAGSWTAAQGGVNGVTVAEENDFFGAGTDRVTVSIPRALAAPGSKFFARLRVDIP
jgi:autotransporter-associated beta strand protein